MPGWSAPWSAWPPWPSVTRPDAVMIGAWALAAVAFAGGWWQASHQKPPEDLSHDIVPRDE